MGQEGGEKWTAAVDLQPTIRKSDRLLGMQCFFATEVSHLHGAAGANLFGRP